jgi:hypothetical protein
MDLKEFFREIVNSFFVIFTCTILGYVIYVSILGFERVPVSDIVSVIVVTVLTSMAGFILYTKHEPKKYELLVRHILHYFAILGIVLLMASFVGWISWGAPYTVIRFVVLITAIFVSVHAVIFYQSKKLADRMTEKLKEMFKD